MKTGLQSYVRLPQLSSLRVFEAAARYENFAKAAAVLNVTHGAVSKQIKSLEADLGEALFHRRNRGAFLTERGRWLAARLSLVFSDLEATLREFKSESGERPLIVSCEPTLCLKLLIPNLSTLRAATGLDVRVLAAGGQLDFRRDHIDLAIRRNDFAVDGAMFVADLADEAMGPVCAPTIRLGGPGHRHDHLSALHTKTRPDAWAAWNKRGPHGIHCGSDVIYEHFYLAIEAAMAGQGIAMASIYMVATDIEAGRLEALAPFKRDGTRYIALSNGPLDEDNRKTRFIDWFARRMDTLVAPFA